MNTIKILLLTCVLFLLCFITILIIKWEDFEIFKSNFELKYIVFLNELDLKNYNKVNNWIYYYDKNLELKKKEKIDSESKLSNQIRLNNKIYLYGYGGFYETDIDLCSTKMKNDKYPVNIVKFDNNKNIYFYQNGGYKNNNYKEYDSIILKNDIEYIYIDYPLVDFCVFDDYVYVTAYKDISLMNGVILIYNFDKLVKEYNVDLSNGEGKWAIINKNVFFLKENSAYKLNNLCLEEVFYDNFVLSERPIVNTDITFLKTYINSDSVSFSENKILLKKEENNNYWNYDNTTGEFTDFYFEDKEKILNIDDKKLKINYNSKLHKYKVVNVFKIDKEI